MTLEIIKEKKFDLVNTGLVLSYFLLGILLLPTHQHWTWTSIFTITSLLGYSVGVVFWIKTTEEICEMRINFKLLRKISIWALSVQLVLMLILLLL